MKTYLFPLIMNQPEAMLPKGYEIAFEQFELPVRSQVKKRQNSLKNTLELTEQGNLITTSNNHVKISFDHTTGWLTGYEYFNKQFIQSPLKANFWRAPTDNDQGNNMQNWAKIWQQTRDKLILTFFKQELHDAFIKVVSAYKSSAFKGECKVNSMLYSSGIPVIACTSLCQTPGKCQ